MSLIDLLPKNLPFGKEAPEAEYYFAINVLPKEVVGTVWGIEGKSLRIINSSSSPYEGHEDLTDACNKVLDEALGDFQPEPTKILFGVPDSWLLDDNLKDEYLNLLKHLVKELDVTPMAYVSTTHAICHLLQKQTGVPSTAILVNLTDPLVVTVVKAGKIIGTKSAKRTEDLPQDIEKVLMGFSGVEVLPSKIALFGGSPDSLEKYKDELISFNWMSNLPFLHLPKVEVLEDGVGIKAVSLAGASEINPDVIYSLDDQPLVEKKPLISHDLAEPKDDQKKAAVEVAGFVEGDITQMQPSEDEVEPVEESPEGEVERYQEHQIIGSSPIENIIGKVTGALASLEIAQRIPFLKGRAVVKKDGERIAAPNLATLDKKKFIILPALVLLILTAAYIFLPKAKVTIFIDPHVLEKDAQVIADPSITSVDNAASKIPGKIVTTDVSGADKGSATGSKQVGDPAKGAVIIVNASSSDLTLSAGTTLTSSAGIKYTLDTSAQAASKSASLEPGKSSPVSVTASTIGPDGNLNAGGDNLAVAGYDKNQVIAQVSTNISGGTSKNVTVVTSDDQKRLLASLASQLRQKAQTQIQGQLSGDEKILPEALDEQIGKTVYSKNVGDQASDFTLNLSIHYKGTAYSDTDLKTMVGKLVETNVPDGYMLNLADTQTQADVSKLNKDGSLVFLAKFKANLIPRIDTDAIKKQIEGKTPSQAASIIQGVTNVIGSDISITPTIPGPLQRLPFIADHISFDVTTK